MVHTVTRRDTAFYRTYEIWHSMPCKGFHGLDHSPYTAGITALGLVCLHRSYMH